MLTTGAMLKSVAESVENCAPSRDTCTLSIAVVPYATEGHVMVSDACE